MVRFRLVPSVFMRERPISTDVAHGWKAVLGLPLFVGIVILLKGILAMWTATQSHFVPDEYFQSTEVAYYHHFGKGHLTWEWHVGIRSYIYPGLIKVLYQIGSMFGWNESAQFLVLAPMVFQMLLSYVAFVCYYHFVHHTLDPFTACTATHLLLGSWFTTYCAPRLITNQVEFSLNCIALYLFRFSHFELLTFVLGLNFMIRPTCAVIWICMVGPIAKHMWSIGAVRGSRLNLFLRCGEVGIWTLGIGMAVDLYMTGGISFAGFYKFNVRDGGSALFGKEPYLWYFYNGLPSIFGWYSVFLLAMSSWKVSGQMDWYCAKVVFVFLFIFSLLDHKEIRFLLPVLPFAFVSVAATITDIAIPLVKGGTAWGRWIAFRLLPILMTLFYAVNLVTVVAVGKFHQSNTYGLSQQITMSMKNMTAKNVHVWVMLPCYNIPAHTFMHIPDKEVTFEQYICPPKQYRHFYDREELFQPDEGLSSALFMKDIERKLDSSGPPELVMAFNGYSGYIHELLERNGAKYSLQMVSRYSVFYDPDIARWFPWLDIPTEKYETHVLRRTSKKPSGLKCKMRSSISVFLQSS